mgnify:CR=1 FL=1
MENTNSNMKGNVINIIDEESSQEYPESFYNRAHSGNIIFDNEIDD